MSLNQILTLKNCEMSHNSCHFCIFSKHLFIIHLILLRVTYRNKTSLISLDGRIRFSVSLQTQRETITRFPTISYVHSIKYFYVVQQACLYTNDPRNSFLILLSVFYHMCVVHWTIGTLIFRIVSLISVHLGRDNTEAYQK